jgi:7,8-dihydroneopterin aldolase/epimerase/oxygenase
MNDRIELRGLRLVGIVGVLPEERTRPQPLEVDVDLHVDLARAASTDELSDTVDYGAVCDTIAAVVDGAGPQLLERLAGVLADELLATQPLVGAVEIALRKLRPPVPHQLSSSGVRVLRRRS